MEVRRAILLRDELGQFIEISADFQLPGDTAVVTREGNRLIVTPIGATESVEGDEAGMQ